MTRPVQSVCDARVIERRDYAPEIVFIRMNAPAIARTAMPGQFVMVGNPVGGTDPLLRRPFSVCGVGGNTIHIMVQVRGRGTALLARVRTGDVLQVSGPHGNGFSLPDSLTEAILVGGGIGIAPLIFLGRFLQHRTPHVNLNLFYGTARAASTAVIDHFPTLRQRCTFTTEDGGRGGAGLVTEAVEAYLTQQDDAARPGGRMYACGPNLMLKRIAEQARARGLPCQVSLEAMMACGVGACMGCVIEDRNGAYRRVCAEGPVFDAEVLW